METKHSFKRELYFEGGSVSSERLTKQESIYLGKDLFIGEIMEFKQHSCPKEGFPKPS